MTEGDGGDAADAEGAEASNEAGRDDQAGEDGEKKPGFSWVLLWTVLGALLPGVGLIAAGRRLIGGLVLALLTLGLIALAAGALFGDPIHRAIELAVDPRQLLILAIAVAVVALLWVCVIVLTGDQLRRGAGLSTGQAAFSWLLVVALVAGIGVPTYKFSHDALLARGVIRSVFNPADAEPEPAVARPDLTKADPWAGKPRVNVLLIGSDAGPDRTGIRPDTMILASINTKTGDTLLFSLPRNLENAPFAAGTPGARAWPNGFNCGDQCLLNAIWTWASGDGRPYYKKYKNPGLQATKDAVQGVTGLKVDTYVMLNLKGFEEFVNAIGGITVNVQERLPIGGDVENPVAVGGWIEKGNHQHLYGYKALWFARSRWASSDYDRMQRQRCVIGDVVSQANPVTMARAFPKIAQAAKENLSTGIPRGELSAWIDLAQRIKAGSVKSLPFTTAVINPGNPNFKTIRTLVAQAVHASDHPAPPASATPAKHHHAKTTTKAPDETKPQDVTKVC